MTMIAPPAMADGEAPVHWRIPRLAKRLGIAETAIYNAVRAGDLPATRFGEKIILVTLEDGLAWMESKSRPIVGTRGEAI